MIAVVKHLAYKWPMTLMTSSLQLSNLTVILKASKHCFSNIYVFLVIIR
jgi:hypothetical protein